MSAHPSAMRFTQAADDGLSWCRFIWGNRSIFKVLYLRHICPIICISQVVTFKWLGYSLNVHSHRIHSSHLSENTWMYVLSDKNHNLWYWANALRFRIIYSWYLRFMVFFSLCKLRVGKVWNRRKGVVVEYQLHKVWKKGFFPTKCK